MSMYGSQQGLNMGRRVSSKGDLAGGGSYHYARSEVVHGGGNGYDPYMDGYKTYTFSKSTGMGGGMGSGTMSGVMSQMASGMEGGTMTRMSGSAFGAINQRAEALQSQCNEYLKKADYAMQAGSGDTEYYMGKAKDAIEKLKYCAMDLRQMGQPNDNVIRSLEICKDRLKGAHMAMTSSMQRRRSTRGSSGGWEDPGRSFHDAMAWIGQHKRLIETALWGDDPAAIEQQLTNHQRFHTSIQRSPEMDRARDELAKKGDKGSLHALEQEWDSLQQMSFGRTQQLQDLMYLIQEISREIMWVNDREEEELMFDWGDKNVDQYIPKKQESYSKLMSALEDKEMELNKLKAKVDNVLKNNHPAADKIEAYKDTLQTQWSWLLQITKCIDVHLKENGAYSQFFKEANDTYSALQKEHETVRKNYPCDKSTSLENLLELLRGLEREKEKIMENKRQVQHLVNRSKSIVRLKPRNPEEKSNHSVIVKALCDFKQDQKVICKDNEAILKDNSQRSKWQVTGPGGLDMLVPSVCLIVPPPNPLSISLANKNEQYYEAILSIWNQLYINVKSLIAWQYCLLDIRRINSLTINMLAKMRPEEYRQIIKSLETHYEEFKLSSHGSQMFADEDKRSIENQFTGAQAHYDQLVVQLPTYVAQQEQIEIHQVVEQPRHQFIIIQQQPLQQDAAEEEARRLEEERQRLELKIMAERKAAAEQEARRIEEERQRLEIKIMAERKAAAEQEARRIEEERRRVELKKIEKKAEVKKEVVNKEHVVKKEVVKVVRTEPVRRRVSSSSVSSASSSSHSLSELHSLRLRLEAAESMLTQHLHVCVGEDAVHDCGLKIIQLETVQRDVDAMRDEYLSLRERILRELEGMNDSDKAQFLRSEIGVINQRLGSLECSSSAYVQRLRALRDMLESVARAEDIVKVHEARLTEKETTSLSPGEVDEYMLTLKNVKAELDQKKDVLASMEKELAKASHWNSQLGDPFHRCDMMLSKYTEQVGVLSDRWRRIQGQIDTRLQDLKMYVPQLQHYKQTSTSLFDWIDATTKKQNALQATKIENIQALKDHITNQKALNTEIKAKRETVERVLKDNEACVNTIKDYETDLSSYTSGLETLLNVPIKRTMLKSPSMDLNQEAIQLQTRYMELLTMSGDYHKFLGESLKNMEELKIRNTRIDLLEEELRLLREDIQDCNGRNKSLEDTVARYQLELSQSQEQLLSVEEVKRNTALQCNATKESLDSTQSQLTELSDQVTRLTYLLDEEKRKRKLAEERYNQQQEEYESVLRKRQNELETVSWSKMDVEKSVANKDHEIENLRRQLDAETARVKELQTDISKVRSQCNVEINNLKLSYESQIHASCTDIQRLAAQRDEDAAELQMQYDRMEGERRSLEEEVRRLRMSVNQAEEQRMRTEEEAQSQRAVIIEEGRRRRELESQVELLMSQRDEENSEYREELAELMKALQDKSDQLAYVTHSLDEENRRRKTIEEGQAVLEQTVTQLQVKLTSSSVATTQLREYDEELQKMRLELERESKERSRVEQNISRLNSRIKDLQAVRDGLESQMENLRIANQEEVARRRQVEAELEKTTITMTEYATTITALRKSQEQASTSGKRGEEERLRLQEELERSLRENKTSAEHMTQLNTELKALQQQLLQEQARLKEAKLRNDGLYRTIEEKSKALNENTVQLESLKEMTETQTKERLRLEEELRAAHHDKEELLRSKQGMDDELSSQITALDLQLQASERSNKDYHSLVSELSSEREKLKLETENMQTQATETRAMMQSFQSQYNDVVKERDAELRNKQRLQEENERVKRDLSYWKDQCDSKQGMIRQYDTDKEILEREKKSLKSEIERLMRELKDLDETNKSRLSAIQTEMKEVSVRQTKETELKTTRAPPTLETSTAIFDGVRKPVTANQLLDCGVLDKSTFNQLMKGHKTVPEVSVDKKVNLKGTGPIAGVVIESPKSPGSRMRPLCKMTFTEAKKDNLLPQDSVDLLLDAQAATGHIIDPRTNQKLTVEEACNQGVVDDEDRERLLSAEAAAVGFGGPGISKPLSVFQAMKKGLIDKTTTLRLLQAQEATGGILDPLNSVFLPKDTAIARDLIDDTICHALSKRPELYLDPENEEGVTYSAMKRRCRVDPDTGLLLLPIPEKVDPSKLVFDGVRKPVTANQLFDCGVLDKPTFKDLEKGKKTVPEVSEDKKVNLKGTGPIAGVVVGSKGKMSFTQAKKQMLLSDDSADLLLEAQAATGHIIDPKTNQKLTVEEACAKGVVDIRDEDKLLAAEAAAIGYKDPNVVKPLSVFEAMKKGLIEKETALRLLQAQVSSGGILDPNLSVFLPKDTAIKRKIFDENLHNALSQTPECYLDPETEHEASYEALKKQCKIEPHTGLLLLPITEKLDPSKLIFDGVRKPVTAQQLLDCGVLDKPTVTQLMKGEKTVPEVSEEKKIFLKGTGSIAGVAAGPSGKVSFSEAKKKMLIPPDSADLLLEAQAATGHIIDPTSNQKLTVDEACVRGVVDNKDRDKLLAAERAAVGYRDPNTAKPLSVFEAMKKGMIDRNTGVRLLQAQELAGGILDPNLSVFLPKDTAIKRNLLDEDLCHALNQDPQCYLNPDTERNASYGALKKRCKTESHTGLMLLPITERKDPSKLMFDGVRKPVSAQQLFECGVLDKPTFNQLTKGEKTVPEVSEDKKVSLKGTGPIAGIVAGRQGKMSLSEAKKQNLLPEDGADLLLEAQAATGHIIDPKTDEKLTVKEACARGVVDIRDQDKLLAAEAAAIGYKDPSAAKPLSVFEAMKKGLIEKETALRLLQAQVSSGGILDPNLSVFLPKDTAIKRNLLDENLSRALNQSPECYLDPETEHNASYEALKKRCKTEPHTGLLLLPITEKLDPSKLIFDGVRKPVTAQQLLDCGVLDKPTFMQLMKGEKTVPEVSEDKKIFLKGTGSIAGVAAGPLGKMSFSDGKKKMLMPPNSADLLLEAQAATGHIIDPTSNQKLTVDEACARGVVDKKDRDKLLAAERAAVGYQDPNTAKPLSVFEAMKKGMIDRNTGIRLLQAQELAGGILDPNLSVFLPKDTAIKRNLLDEDLCRALNKDPQCYLDPDTERDVSYGALKKRCKTESHTGLMLLPITERKDPSELMFDGVRKPVSAQQLFECGVLDKPTFNQLTKGEKTVPEVSEDKKVNLKGTGPISGIVAGHQGKMSLSEAKKQMLLSDDSADLLLEAQAATGHIIDPKTDEKLTVKEACAKGVVDIRDQDKLLAAEAAAIGYKDPSAAKPLSVFEAMKKGLIEKETAVRLLQAQVTSGGILDPDVSVFLPKDTAIKRNLLDESLSHALNQSPACYLDPETECNASYEALKKKCKTEPHTGLLLFPVTEQLDPSKLIFDGVRKPVTAQQLLDCGVLDKPTVTQLMKGEKTIPEVSEDKKKFLKGTGSIAGVAAGPSGKMSLSEAKKKMLMPPNSADLLLEAQAATGHIIDPTSNQKLTVDEACVRGVVDKKDRDKLLAAERAAVGYRDPNTAKPLSVFEAMKKGMIDRNTGVRLLQAQELAGGILDPNLSVFLPKDTAIKRNLLDEDLCRALNKDPQCYLDPDTEQDASYGALKKRCKTEPRTGLILLPITERKDPSKLMFDGVCKPVSAQQLFDCGLLDKLTFNQLVKGEKTVPIVSMEKKAFLKGTGPIDGIVAGRQGKMSLSEAKKQSLLPVDSADLLLEAQAATGHITDPKTGQKLTVEEACAKGVVDRRDRDRLLAAQAAAIGYKDPSAAKPLSVFEAMKKGLIEKETALRLLQAQVTSGGILDPNLSVFLPKDTAIKWNLLDESLSHALNQSPACYLDPETKCNASYEALKKKCKTEPHTGLLLFPVTEQLDPSKLIFYGVRKPVTAQQLLDCGVLDKPTVTQLMKEEKTIPEVSEDKKVYLKGTGSIAGVVAGPLGKMSFSEAKKKMLMPPDSADLLLEAQAATGHIIDPTSNQKLTVEEACVRGVVENKDRDKLLAAERAAVGYRDLNTAKPLSVFEAMKKGMIDRNTGVRLLQAQELAGGILDPNLSVFLPKDTAIKRNLLDENLCHELNKDPQCYLDPDTERDISYGALKKRCKTESRTGQILLPITERKDPTKLMFDGVRKPVSAQQLLECGILDKLTFNQLVKGEKTIPEVSLDKKVFLKGTGSVAGVAAGPLRKMSFTEAKKQKILTPASADMLLDAQAATGHIIDPRTNQKLTVKEACARGVVNKEDESKLFAAEAAAIGYREPHSAKLLSAGQAMKKGLIDKDTALRVLQAQECVGGILDPSISVFLPKDIAKERDLIDENLSHALNQSPECYLDPDTQQTTTYVSLKKKCKVDPSTGLLLFPEPKKPVTVKGIRDQVSVIDLVDANLLKQSDVDQLREGRLTSQDIEDRLRSYLGGSTCIAGVYDEASDRVLPIYQAMKEELLPRGTTVQLLEAQAASGFIVDPVNNLHLTVSDAYNRGLFGPEFKDKLLAAEMAVTGYKLPGTDSILSLFQAIESGLVKRGQGLCLLQAQLASGGIIDPIHGHRIDTNIAHKRGYFDDEMSNILANEKGFFDPNTEENLTYLELKKCCKTDKKTGLILLPINEKTKQRSVQKNTRGQRRVVIVDPETNEDMTVREAFDKGYIDYLTFIELSKQECEWEEVTSTDPDGSSRCVIIDRKTGREYNVTELLKKQVISQSVFQQYCSQMITLTQFADFITSKTEHGSPSLSSSSLTSSTTSRPSAASGTSSVTSTLTSRPSTSLGTSSVTSSALRTSEASVPSSLKSSSSVMSRPLSPTLAKMTTTKTTIITERGSTISRGVRDSPDSFKHISSISVQLETPDEIVGEQEPVGAIFDTDNVEKISVTEALNRDLVDSITAQRLLEAQACTGGIVNPANGQRLSIQEASRMGLIDDDMATKLKPAQKAFIGFEDVKTKKKMSAAQALKERWLPYEAGQRFMEFQVATGGLYDPEVGCRRTIEDALKMGWLDGRTAQKLQDMKHHAKILTCPKSKLNISYKDALDNCLVEESTGVKILQASSVSSRGISSPYNVASAPGSTTGSRSGSRRSSRRASLDLGSPTSSSTRRYNPTSVTSFPFLK
ncbi:desmoplakin isoform X1 [Amphiprion ocellaris]|uniref:SH3 domain-containing protein n=1 Tax=Amphiprion ocellaris TaxID=80972 RepID=A0A3Q1DB48_AMPOC|nr:desmoplakin isoform X1 [Amphiprion ocellaris]